MLLKDFDLNLLVVFDAIHRSGNLTRAAGSVHLTQSAMSHALARLRRVFGDPLFSRVAQAMHPTPFAHSIAGPVQEALEILGRGLTDNHVFDPKTTRRRFSIGLRDVLETAWLPALAARVAAAAPMVDLVIGRLRMQHVDHALGTGALDLVADISTTTGPETRRRALIESPLVVLLRRDHPALKGKGALDLEAYLALSHVRVSSSRSSPGLEDLALGRLDRRRRIALRCQSFAAACRSVAATDLALTMASVHRGLVESPATTIVPLPIPMPAVSVHLYWHASRDRDAATMWLCEQLSAVATASATCAPSKSRHARLSFDASEPARHTAGDGSPPKAPHASMDHDGGRRVRSLGGRAGQRSEAHRDGRNTKRRER